MKKTTIIAVVAIIIGLMSVLVACNNTQTEYPTDVTGYWKYDTVGEDGAKTAKLISYLGAEENLIIPQTITLQDGSTLAVSALEEGIFVKTDSKEGVYIDNTILKTVSFAENTLITAIPNRAFYCCSELTNIDFGSNIQTIGDFAFYGCSKLEVVIFPTSVKAIGGYAFRECDALTDVFILSEITPANSTELAIPTIGTKTFFMIDQKSKKEDRYYINSDFKIHVKDVSLYNTEVLEANRKETKQNNYKYWSEYEGHFVTIEG